MKKNRLILFGVLIACLPLFLHSQSNTIIDELLDEEKADWGQTTYMVLTAAELLDENTNMAEAINNKGVCHIHGYGTYHSSFHIPVRL